MTRVTIEKGRSSSEEQVKPREKEGVGGVLLFPGSNIFYSTKSRRGKERGIILAMQKSSISSILCGPTAPKSIHVKPQ